MTIRYVKRDDPDLPLKVESEGDDVWLYVRSGAMICVPLHSLPDLIETLQAILRDAAYIVTACNAFPDLMAALTKVRAAFIVEYTPDGKVQSVGYDGDALRPMIAVLDAALAKAGAP